MNPVSAVRRRAVCALLAICLLLSTLFMFIPGNAATVPQTLKVYAQYWGDPDSAKLLREFSREELETLSYSSDIGYEGYYCNVTNVNTVMRIHARGFKLAEFLSEQVGLDLTSIRQLDFHTTDVAADARFVSKGREELLDSTRYYYPNLIPNSRMDEKNNVRVVIDGEAASEGAIQVPTIIAVVQYSTKNPYDDLTGEMTADTSFRLCAGHPDTELWDDQVLTKTSFESAKWIDEIYVVLAGAPPEEPTEPDTPEEPTEPDEKPTGSDITPPEDPTQPEPTAAPKPTEAPKPTDTPTVAPTAAPGGQSTTNSGGSNRLTTRRTQSTATTTATTARSVSTTTAVSETNRQIAEQTTKIDSVKMEQLVVNGYDSLIQWKQESEEEVSPLKKPLVTTKGARNAAILFVASFGAGAVAMYRWFKEEQ